jgi:hypothetical protein
MKPTGQHASASSFRMITNGDLVWIELQFPQDSELVVGERGGRRSCAADLLGSLKSERDRRVHLGSSSCGDVAGCQGHDHQDQRDAQKRQRVVGFDAVELAAE